MIKEEYNRDLNVDENIDVELANSAKKAEIWNKRAKYFANLFKSMKGDKKLKCYLIVHKCMEETAKHLNVANNLAIKILDKYNVDKTRVSN